MRNAPEPACLVIADISGYTSYLAGVELDHAQDILADLMDTVVTAFRPTFRLAKLEGDAAFVYAIAPTVDGSALQDAMERTYFAFRRRLRDIGQASICDCDACTRMPTLDLKLVAHHGTIARQRIAGREELAGRPVIEVHRLLKNEVEATLGLPAYALYSDACVEAMGLADPAAAGLVAAPRGVRASRRDHGLGPRPARGVDRGAGPHPRLRRGEGRDLRRLRVPARAARRSRGSTRRRRPVGLSGSTGVVRIDEETASGRRGVGTTNHCVHGKDAIVEEIVDWRPYEYWTQRMQIPEPGVPKFTLMYEFAAERRRHPAHRPGPAPEERQGSRGSGRWSSRSSARRSRPTWRRSSSVLVEEVARRAAEIEGAVEPEVAASAARYLTTPVESAGARSS